MNNKKNQLYENRKTVERFQKIAGLLTESYDERAEEKRWDDVVWEVANKLSIDEDKAWQIVFNMIGDDVNKDKRAWDLYHTMHVTAEEVADYIANKVGKNNMPN